MMEAAIEAGADDVVSDMDEEGEGHTVYTAFEDLNDVAAALEAKFGVASEHQDRLAPQEPGPGHRRRRGHPDEAARRAGRRRRRPGRLLQRGHLGRRPGQEPTSDQIRDSRGDDVAGRGRAGGDAGIVTNPSWQVPPRPGFPELALRRRIEAGRVELQCPVKADGTIRSCWILSETPAGVGFGQAALTSTVRARLQPRTVDGVATGGMIRFSVNFRLG
jgi:TonB family protein